MADEAHRSQYGLGERVRIEVDENGAETARTVQGIARLVRNALPNATFIGFTGTPISTKDRSTVEVFGECIDVYDMTQAVADHAVCPIYYESRAVKLRLDKATLEAIDREYDALAGEADAGAVERSKKALATMDSLLGSDETVDSFVEDLLEHYEKNREHLLTGKAMVVAYSRPVAWKVYRRILEKRPDWPEGKVALVMTESNQDPEEWRRVVGDKRAREETARRFKDDRSGLKLVVVVDMWLTGFDVPSLATMYLFKPMKEHNLMQAIARVNRVYKDKQGGLVVDYVGIAQALKEAMAAYTKRDRTKLPDMDVSKKVYAQFRERLKICRDIFHAFDYGAFPGGSPKERADAITGGANFLLAPERGRAREDFLKEALGLRQALSLCASLTTGAERGHAAYFEAVRMLLKHLADAGKGPRKLFSIKEINERINSLLKHAIHSEGIVPVIEVSEGGRSLFDPDFLAKIARMGHRNLAVEMLRKLIDDQIRVYSRSRLVKAQVFSEKMTALMNGYLNGQITNEKVIQELLAMANDIMAGDRSGEMSQEELAFYEAITRPEAIKDFYTHDVLVAMTKELTDQLRRNRTVDWQFRNDARAHMRMLVVRLLKKYKYPPEGLDDAMETVLKQCEVWTDNPDFGEAEAARNAPRARVLSGDEVSAEWRFARFLPLYSLRAACGKFGRGEEVEPEGWVEVEGGRLDERMFVVRAVGRSMEPRIHDGDLCVMRAGVEGSREGRIVLAEHRGAEDPEGGGAYSIKRYHSEKAATEDGTWRHDRIVLEPLNPEFAPIEIPEEAAGEFRVVAEWVERVKARE